jgi:hypothetical protein
MHKDSLELAFQVMYNIHPKRQGLDRGHGVRLAHAWVYIWSKDESREVDEDRPGIFDEVARTP